MSFFSYDGTFDGLLSVVFDAYKLKLFPERLLIDGEIEPLFAERLHTTVTDPQKAHRVWVALQKKLSKRALNQLYYVWLSEQQGADALLFRYIRKTIDSPHSIETHFIDEDVLQTLKLAKKVSKDKHYLLQFVRFQKTQQNIYFAAVCPDFNVLPLGLQHFKDRFADQQWALYDIKRQYGYFYNLDTIEEIQLPDQSVLIDGNLRIDLLAENERLYQKLWRNYFRAISIKERKNVRLQRRCMPQRFWHLLPEMEKSVI